MLRAFRLFLFRVQFSDFRGFHAHCARFWFPNCRGSH
jgi:hypothetical protein